MLLGICSFPICEAPHGGSTQVVRPGHTVAWGLQSQLLLAPSQLATTSPTTGKVVFAFCLSSDNIVPYGPSASICCGFSQRRQQPKNLPWVTLKSGSCKIKQCPIVLHSPNPSHFHKAFRQYWGGGGGRGGREKKTLGKQLIRFWQGGPNICFKQKTSAYFTFIFHNLQKQPAKI